MNSNELNAALAAALGLHPDASDFNFSVGKPPQVEVHGTLQQIDFGAYSGPLAPGDTASIATAIMGDHSTHADALEKTGSTDCAYTLPDETRFRVNIFLTRGNYSVVLRVLARAIPTLEELELPPVIGQIPKVLNGMVLVTGATGTGKSTTLAAVIDRINADRAVHIVTLEDPIEFAHKHKAGTVNQRELGVDFWAFSQGLRAALRQAPKVILVGEMRDRETVEIGLKAAETGHLVLSTLHTIDAGQTINRITGMFAKEERQLIRSRLAQVLRYIVGMRLLPREGGGRVPALEIMGSNLRVRELIQNGEGGDKNFYSAIADSRPIGWQTFDQHIMELYEQGSISAEVAKSYSSDLSSVTMEIDKVRARRGEETSDIGDLEMETVKRLR